MKKDKEIWLEPEEIQQLLEGGLYWADIEPKLAPENADSFRRHAKIEPEEEPGGLNQPQGKDWEPDEQKDVRAILLGEENRIIKDRQIDFSNLEDGVHHSFVPLAAADEERDLEWEESNNEMKQEADNEFKDIIFSSEIESEEDERTPFGGLKLILLLTVAAALTFGFWFYFLNS